MAIYQSKGRISAMSEVQSGTSKSGYQWQNMNLTLDIFGAKGIVTKLVLRVAGDAVDEVLQFAIGDKVEVSFIIYAREWNGKWYNNVELVSVTADVQDAAAPAPSSPDQADGGISNEQTLDPGDHADDLPF